MICLSLSMCLSLGSWPCRSATSYIRHTMTSVNSPACLLARNRFYRSMTTHTHTHNILMGTKVKRFVYVHVLPSCNKAWDHVFFLGKQHCLLNRWPRCLNAAFPEEKTTSCLSSFSLLKSAPIWFKHYSYCTISLIWQKGWICLYLIFTWYVQLNCGYFGHKQVGF